MLTGVHGERARHPQIVQGVVHGLPVPPAAAPAGRTPAIDLTAGHRTVGLDGRAHGPEHPGIRLEPRPAGVVHAIVEHGPAPPRQHRGRHQARRVRPVLEQQPPLVDQPVQTRAVVRPEAAPQGQVVRALEDVDGVELQTAHVLDEADEPGGRERRHPRAGQVLPLEEERGDGSRRKGQRGETDSTASRRRRSSRVSRRGREPSRSPGAWWRRGSWGRRWGRGRSS